MTLPSSLQMLRLWISMLNATVLFSAQETPLPSPLAALEALATQDSQPRQPGGVPLQARAHLEALKDRLGPWALAKLALLGEGTTCDIGQQLSKNLDSIATAVPTPEHSFWHPLHFQVETPESHPELLVLTTRFGIDATLLLFRRGQGGWRLIWQDRAPAYAEIDAAFGSYTTVMTPKATDGACYLAAARITPWYQSNWRSAELRVFRIGPDGVVRRIGQREEGVFIGDENPMSLTVQDAQQLAFRVRSASSDPGRHSFPRIFCLRLDSKGLHRVPPYAETPMDLVDEWLNLPWAEAAALTDPPTLARLRPLHARLRNRDENLLTFDEEIKQDKASGIWEVQAELERDDKLETFVFHIRKTEDGLRLLDIKRRKP